MKLFISYSSENRKKARKIYKALKKHFDVWIDEKGLLVGDDFEREISNEIDNRNIYLLLLSNEFWESEFIYEKELPRILKNKFTYIVPMILDNLSNLDDKKGNFILNKGFTYLNATPRDINGDLTTLKELGFKKSLKYLINEIKRLPLTETYFRFSLDILKLLHYECKYENIEIIEVKEREVIFKLDSFLKSINYGMGDNEYYKEYLINTFTINHDFKNIKDKIYKEKFITKAYLEEKFGYLFPVQNKVFKKVFKTKAIENLITKIKDKKKVHIIASAGIGKTSAMKYIKKEFSKDKIVIFYDVFGEGNYKENKRYKKDKILQQITNELAILNGLEPIISGDFESYLRKYLDKLAKWNKKIVIILDAVDNAISAMQENGDNNFIAEFLNWDMPDNIQIIVTSREGKRADVGAEIEKIRLEPFDLEDTKKFLQLKHIKIENISKFYYLTKGIGRVCEYAIENIDNFMEYENPVLLPNIFQTIYDDTTKVLLKDEKDIFDVLVLLKRPIKVNEIVEIFDFKKEKILNVINTMKLGMFIQSDELIFKDEDFEKFLEDKIENKTRIHKIISSKLLENSLIYTKKVIAYHLYNAKMKEELFQIALEDIDLDDEITKKEVLKERISLALKVAFDKKNYFLISKLLLKALEIKKSELVLEEFIDTNPEIMFLKGIEEGVEKLQNRYKNEELFFLAYYLYDKDREKANYFYEKAKNSIKDLSRFTTQEQIEKLAYYLSYQYVLDIEKSEKKKIILNQNYKIWFELEIIKHLKIDFNLSKEDFQKTHILKQLLIAYLEYKKGNKTYLNYIDDNFRLNKDEIQDLSESKYEKDIRDILGIELAEIFLIERKNYNELLKIFKPKDFKEFYGEHNIKNYKNTIFYYSLFPPNELLLENEYKKFICNLKLIYDFYILALKDEIDINERWDNLFKNTLVKDYNNRYKEQYLEFQKHIVLFKIAVLKLPKKINMILDRLKKIPWYEFEIIEFLISQNEKTLALRLIENNFDKILKEETEIRDKINELIELSEITKKIDINYSNEILKYAIDMTNGVDDNIYNNYAIIKHLVKNTKLSKDFQNSTITTLYNSMEAIRSYSYKFKPYYIVKEIASNLDEELYLGVSYRMDLDNYEEFSNSFDYYLDKDLTNEEKFAFRYFVNNKKLLHLLKDTPLYDKLIEYIMVFEKNETKYDLLKNSEEKEFVKFYENEIVSVNKKDIDFEVTRENYKQLLKEHYGYKKEIFEKLKNILSNQEILNIMQEHIKYDFSYFYEEFFEILEHPLFKRQKNNYIKEAIKKYSKYLTMRNWSSLKYNYFFKYLDEKEVVDILIQQNLNLFSDEIYVENIGYLVEIVSELLNKEQKIELIQNNLEIITKEIELNKFEIEEMNLLEFLWRFLSYPDKRKRFKAMYVLKDLIYANPSKYLQVINKLDDTKPFENKYILNLSGIWYLLMLLHKISFENPIVLNEIKDKLFQFFNSTKHILFKRIIKEILINIDVKYIEILKFEVISKSNKLKNDTFYSENFESPCMRNSWDTIHYWYKDISNMFEIDMQEIIDIADKYLKKWNICINELDYKNIHIDLPFDRDNYYIIANRHGTLPTVEQLDIYLEFHLMFYIVGELLESKSVRMDFYSDMNLDRFEDWIEKFYITKSYWCSDNLSTFPFIKGAFKEIELKEFKDSDKEIVLEGKFNKTTIYSAFISNEFADEFQNKIKQYEKMDYYEFVFPEFDDEKEKWIQRNDLIETFKIIDTNHCEIQDDNFLNRSYCYRFKTNLEFLKYKEWGEEKNTYFKDSKKGYMVYSDKNKLLNFLKDNKLTLFRMFIKYKDKKNEFCFIYYNSS